MPDAYDDLLNSLASAQPKRVRPTTPHLDVLTQFAKDNKLTVGSTTGGRHNRGSLHYSGNAIDIKGSGAFDDPTVQRLTQAARERGLKLRDERRRPAGQKVWGGPHVHLEYAGVGDEYDKVLDSVASPQKPKDEYDSLLDSLASPGQQPAPKPRAAAPPVLTRRPQPKSDPTANLLSAIGQAGGAVTSQVLDRKRPKITSRADIMRAEEAPQPSRGTYTVDPRLAKGEQPSDPMAYAKAQELVGRVEPIREVGGIRAGATAIGPRRSLTERVIDTVKDYAPGIRSLDTPMGPKTDPIRGAASLGLLDLRREITPEEKLIDPNAGRGPVLPFLDVELDPYSVGQFAPAIVPYAVAGKVVSKIPSLAAATREAHIARTALTFGGVELGRELVRSAQTGEPLNPKEVAISTAIGGGIGGLAGVNPSLKRQIVAFITPGVVADVVKGTDPQTATFNALTNLAFGLHSYQGAPREVRNAAKLAAEPLQRRLERGELQREQPSVRDRSEQQVQPVSSVGLQVEPQRSAGENVVSGRQGNQTRTLPTVQEAPPQDRPTPAPRVEDRPADIPAPVKAEFQHKDFGRVVEAESQSGVSRGQIRVVDEQGTPHVILKPKGTGAGNIRAIPVKPVETPAAAVEPPVKPEPPSVAGEGKALTVRGKTLETAKPIPADALRIINKTFNQTVGPDIYSELPRNPTTQDVVQLLAEMGLSDQIMSQAAPALRKAGYARIADVLITGEGLRHIDPTIQKTIETEQAAATQTIRDQISRQTQEAGLSPKQLAAPQPPEPKVSTPPSAERTLPQSSARPTEVTPATPPLLKREPWQLTKQEYADSLKGQRVVRGEKGSRYYKREGQIQADHKLAVDSALQLGKPVPAEVVKQYPDLAVKYPTAAKASLESPPPLKREVKPVEARKPADIDPSEYVNLRKLNISAEEKANLENTVRQVVSEGRVSKERVSFEDIKREAAEIDPELVRSLKPPKRGETLDPVVRFAARERLNTLNAESVRLQKELDAKRASAASDPKEIEQLESRLAQTEIDAKGVLDVLIPTRSQDGRNLAFHAMQAKQSFDADYWLSKARRVAERSGEDVTSGRYQRKEKTIRDTLVAGRDAETRLADLERQVSELRAKLEKADSGALPEGKAPRAFRQKAQTLQAKLDTAAEQARMRLKQRAESGGVQGGQAGASTIPLDIADYAIIGASKLARKGISTAVWTEEMIAEFGESIRPHIRSIYGQSYKVFQDESKALREAARVQTVTEGQPQRYTQAEIAKLVEQADAARKDVQKNRAQLARTFSNLEKTSVLETISALRKAGLLTGVKTHLRNVGSTAAYQVFDEAARVPAAITDLAVSAVTRRRSISGPNPVAVGRSSYQAATKGIREAVQILKQGATQEDLAKLDIKREVNSGWRVIDAYSNGVFRLLGAEDKVFKTYAIKRSLEDQARVIALNESRAGRGRGEIKARTKELSESPTAEMAAQAITDAEVATFNNRGVLSGAIQRGKSHLGQGGRFGLDLLVPFVQTPSNVFTRLIEATPLGGVKAIGRGALATFNKNFTIEEQRAFSQTMGRSATGTALILLGYTLASKGLATGTRDDEPAKNERDKAVGRSSMAIRVGDQWHQVGAFSPLANMVAIGATLYREEHQELKDESQRPLKIAAIAGKTALEQPMLKGVSSLTETLTQPGRSAPRLLGNIAGSFVPTLMSDAGAAMDNKRRDVRGIQDAVVNRLPLLRRTLPESVDVFGRPMESRRTAAVDPTLSSRAQERSDPLMAELVRLDVGVPKSSRKPEESEDRYRARIIAEGNAMEMAARNLMAIRAYKTLDDDKKREAFKDAFEEAKRFVKSGGKRAPRQRPDRELSRIRQGVRSQLAH